MKTQTSLNESARVGTAAAGGGGGRPPEKQNSGDGGGGAGRPIRILIIGPSLNILGGQAVQLTRLLTRLRAEPSLEVSFLPIDPELPRLLRWLQSIKYVRTIATSLLYLGLLLARVRHYDIVHIFSASYSSFALAPTPAVIVARLYGKRTVLNYRSGMAEDHLTRWRRTALPTIRLFDRIIVPSGYLVDVFARFGFHADPIFNIIETEKFRFRERRSLRPAFLSNRNFESLYNVACVLRAFALIQRRVPEAQLVVAGYGPQRAELEALAGELGLRHTQFVGRVSPEKMFDLIDAAEIYLNAPNIDNMPNSILEAFASGLPVVTTNAGGIPYIVTHEETGLLVECDDDAALAASAIRLLEDDGLALRIATQARRECHRYSWGAVRDQWLSLYHELMSEELAEVGRGEGIAGTGAAVGERQ